MKEFIIEFSYYSGLLLPILGVILLFILIIAALHLMRTVKKLPDSVDRVDTILNGVNSTIEKIQTPVDAVVNVSKSVDGVNSTLNSIAMFFAQQFVKNYSVLKDMIVSIFSGGKHKDSEASEMPDPDVSGNDVKFSEEDHGNK